MSTYYIRVSVDRDRVVKVEAEGRHIAEIAAARLLSDNIESYPISPYEVLAETVTEDDYFDFDDDSIIARETYDGIAYEFAADDPAGRGL